MTWLIKVDGEVFGQAAWWKGRLESREKAELLFSALRANNPGSRVELVEDGEE